MGNPLLEELVAWALVDERRRASCRDGASGWSRPTSRGWGDEWGALRRSSGGLAVRIGTWIAGDAPCLATGLPAHQRCSADAPPF